MKSKVVYIEDEISEKLSRYLKRDGMTFSGFVRKEIVRYIEEKEAKLRDATDGRR